MIDITDENEAGSYNLRIEVVYAGIANQNGDLYTNTVAFPFTVIAVALSELCQQSTIITHSIEFPEQEYDKTATYSFELTFSNFNDTVS